MFSALAVAETAHAFLPIVASPLPRICLVAELRLEIALAAARTVVAPQRLIANSRQQLICRVVVASLNYADVTAKTARVLLFPSIDVKQLQSHTNLVVVQSKSHVVVAVKVVPVRLEPTVRITQVSIFRVAEQGVAHVVVETVRVVSLVRVFQCLVVVPSPETVRAKATIAAVLQVFTVSSH